MVAHGVFHLRRLGPRRADTADVGAEVGIGDAHRGDLPAEVEDRDVLIDQPADLLGVLARVEVAVGRVPVAAPGGDLDLAEEANVVDEPQRFGSRQHGVEGGEEHPQRHVEIGSEPFVAE